MKPVPRLGVRLAAPVVLLSCLVVAPVLGAGFADLESQVRDFTLPNGLTFIVLERHEAPVFAFRTYVDAGGVNEVAGETGVAHMFEHMAFKGTQTVGTSDYQAEKKALDAVDDAWDAYAAEMRKGYGADSTRLATLEQAFRQSQEAARKYVVSNDFSKILEEQGAVGLNAGTMMDGTMYFYNLPSNRLELWARLEGDRLTQPVLREFYTERSVVQEERRFQESSPLGRAFATWWMASFLAHPYGNGIIGFPSDLQQITRRDARNFFDRYYVAPNITIAVVGDVDFDQVKKLAEKYFSGVRNAPKPPPVRTKEPRHEAEIRVTIEENSQPAVVVGYHIPSRFDPDWPAYELMGDILASGRTSRLYDRLVKKDKIAVQAVGGTGFPGDKYPNLLILQSIVARGASTDQVEAAIYEELDRFVADGPTQEELDKVKTRERATFIRRLRSNQGLSGELASWGGVTGDWRGMFDYLSKLDAVSTDDIRRIAQDTFRQGNRTVGVVRKPEQAS